ncbi:pentapeptide repeat-containing protein [Streptomyces collinus]|uniref:pentapeptide repeat-containing protein n=1 Tax=Streptomyces collinus TaxID=42684 RepID=UPI00380D9C35
MERRRVRTGGRRGDGGRGGAPWLTLAATLPGLAALIALLFNWVSVSQNRTELQIAEQAQFTTRFNEAVTHLGSPSPDVRFGGIYALERIMQDSPRDQPRIVAVLSAYVRTHARISSDALPRLKEPPPLAPDVVAATEVLADRPPGQDGHTQINWRESNLRGLQLESRYALKKEFGGDASAPPYLPFALASLIDADLQKAKLFGVDLHGADASNVNLAGATLTEVKLSYADLSGADLTEVTLKQVSLRKAFLSFATLVDAELHGTDLAGASLDDANLAGAHLHSGPDVNSGQLIPTNLTDASLLNANLTGADLEDEENELSANLHGAHLNGVKLTDADLSGVDLSGADLGQGEGYTFDPANLSGADLESANLAGANLGGANLKGANLVYADLTGANLGGANLKGANLTGANLKDANLDKAVGLVRSS